MKTSPAFQFYPSDWLSSQRVQLMTLEEEGAYIRLLCYCWNHGSIPNDPEKIARIISKGASTTLATTLATMFQPDGDKLVHERLEAEREKQATWKAKSSEGGKKSAESRKKQREEPKNSRVVEPPLEGSLENGSNQTSTLQSSVFSLLTSSPPAKKSPPPSDGRHSAITKGFGAKVKEVTGQDYVFQGRDASRLKSFLAGYQGTAEEFLETYAKAWKHAEKNPYSKHCKEASTISGMCERWNGILQELQLAKTTAQNGHSRPSQQTVSRNRDPIPSGQPSLNATAATLDNLRGLPSDGGPGPDYDGSQGW